MNPESDSPPTLADRGRRVSAAAMRGFRGYAAWLVAMSWKRFFLLAVLLLVAAAFMQNLPPFTRTLDQQRSRVVSVERSASAVDNVKITIDLGGKKAAKSADAPASAASGAGRHIELRLPQGLSEQAREAIAEAVRDAQEQIDDAVAEERAARREHGGGDAPIVLVKLSPKVHTEDWPTDLALLWIVASAIIKVTHKSRIAAEAQAAVATETAEAEALKRQVVEARMAAMQAQVEPHFLFNTLASIDHLIETDAPRASRMQKNLIALLRASMPSLREAGSGAPRSLGRELDLVRPYLEILKMRMDDRLHTLIDVPEGLLSAEFPAMMLQSLVENAIKHGLEPKPEGGGLTLRAQVVHGKLSLSVADTGLGFGRAATGGTGVGLANIRARLALLYGGKATLVVADNPGGGTLATITVPYRSLEEHSA